MGVSKMAKYHAVLLVINVLTSQAVSQNPAGSGLRSDTPPAGSGKSKLSQRVDNGGILGGRKLRGDTAEGQQDGGSSLNGDSGDRNRMQVSESYLLGGKSGEEGGVAGDNCSCHDEMRDLKRDLLSEAEERQALKKVLNTYVAELYQLRDMFQDNRTRLNQDALPSEPHRGASFSAKLSFNRELKPLDTVVFDSVLSNTGHAYDPDTGVFKAPGAGTYLFHSTILSGYNTKIETAIIVNDNEVARMYSGAHDAHGSGSNMAVVDLNSGDEVLVRLLYQGGNHIHGYYSTFSGALLVAEEK